MAEYTEKELRAIGSEIVAKSKGGARVDTGYLKRSISYVLGKNNLLIFTEVFYGQFGDNSDLEENIRAMVPDGLPWELIYTDEDGGVEQVVKSSASGRLSVTNATKATTRKSLGINGIKNFLRGFIGGKAKNSGTD